MPPDVLDQAVDVLQELPGQAGLADAGRTDDAHQADAALAGRGVEVILELAELLVPPDEGRLERLRPTDPAALGDDAERPPGRDRADLALQDLLAGRLEDDRARRRSLGRLPDEDGARRSHRLEAAGRVDQVAADHALVGGAERDCRLAGQDPGTHLEAGGSRRVVVDAQSAHGVDEVERRADGPLGVVLAGHRRAPQGHDCVADELLDAAAVALDAVRHGREVPLLEVADLLGVPSLG